ncbi:MAG: aspartate carbamoyltransferase [Candidatus Magasanikbacteria bacterium RIFCSPHIGHO2_01_FULL_33_34]|uniref:Aspartate carbamoyltransferase n=1 Tax=Candidatus Magasanikbacteria bacterium RIFCSPHIGHO2_01_FULL_33_34 TaxID=1798671 RepID=A0A1F6LJR6_9BACT|nr:MAG: aspartate carbamoyltransferase [Candidatus Magasanikbacteria bacterium RIFCSPHIGHO2_01_FULL_33_34]OGH65586.1 MAG: aspartate carbamoyltransferase [Candidatus Magasanikbacteria bacterium RIFCSPHIGHO2_02_FULL_33_17]OGH76306.1 MAG: aspartate carbamoyltransferase [Candidatus Magasanikbacteria bacterium RIFCSPLOWO2_01_FULL_33_34]OGH81650.1 MAG: aspartate carbamoyltransferase [Candidatus Magasanikbacteria bacterium RIFCSPLOWO2_12_FULL_34_7]
MPTEFKNRDIISITDLSKSDILHILKVAEDLKKKPRPDLLKGNIMASCFFENSTRTRLSFETAMLRLGGNVTGFSNADVTSIKKGETLYDTIKIIGQYVDVIALRHPLEGAAKLASEATDKPIINGGDGANQHPTQTLLDLFTIRECQKKLTDLKIALVGDLKYGRTVHSLAQALVHFGVRLYLIAPNVLQMPNHILDTLKLSGIKFSMHENMESIINKVDIIYMTRIQEERFTDKIEYERLKDSFILKTEHLKKVQNSMRIMHPLPRVNEISPDVDKTKHAYYFEQAKNGLFVRQAILGLLLGKLN